MLSPPTGFQGSHGQEKKEQGDADKIHDVRRVYHAPCEIVKMSTDTDFSDDLTSLSADRTEGAVSEEALLHQPLAG